MTRPAFDIRLATNADGPAIAALGVACGWAYFDDLDWSDVGPYWLVAEMRGVAVGAIHTGFGKPVGRLEFLAVDPDLGHRDRALVTKELCYQGAASLRLHGARLIVSMTLSEHKSWRRVLQQRGCLTIAEGTIMAKRI